MSLLELREVCVNYGRIAALQKISLQLRQGELVALIGANGAGKTTTLRTISGLIRAWAGQILFRGEEITRLRPEAILRSGIAHCPEGRELFPEMTALENLEMGAYIRTDGQVGKDLEHVYRLFPALRERRDQKVGSLSGGEQQMVAIGRALMSKPGLILFDEPFLGLAPYLVHEVARAIERLNAEGVSILLVEQNVHVAFAIAQRGYVMENGRIVLEGPMEQLQSDERVKRAYLGG